MSVTLHSLRSILLAVGLLLTGHGLHLTLLPLYGQSLGWSDAAVGLTGSAYYIGFIIGCLSVPALVRRVGHIRTFAACVASASIGMLLLSLLDALAVWLMLRALLGWSLAALYTVIESWLNERATNENRGSVLATYTCLSLGAMACGQLFVGLGGVDVSDLFSVVVVLMVAGSLPIALTTQAQPAPPADIRLNWRFVYRASHVGLVCSALAGVVLGLIWGVGSVYATDLTGDQGAGARFAAAVLLGGLVIQMPVGRLSDYVDRRWVILLLAGVGVAGGLALFVVPAAPGWLYAAAFLCGGATLPMYAVCVAHANDNADGRFLEIASGMLIANAAGAAIGPLTFALMVAAGIDSAFAIAVVAMFAACGAWTLMRLGTHDAPRDFFEPYQPLTRTTPELVAIDPRADDGARPAPESVSNPVVAGVSEEIPARLRWKW